MQKEHYSVPSSKGKDANVDPAGHATGVFPTQEGPPGMQRPPQSAGNVNVTNTEGWNAPGTPMPASPGPSLTAPKPAPNVQDCSGNDHQPS